jgi:hypothetical protein
LEAAPSVLLEVALAARAAAQVPVLERAVLGAALTNIISLIAMYLHGVSGLHVPEPQELNSETAKLPSSHNTVVLCVQVI